MKILILGSRFFGYAARVANELAKNHDVCCDYAYTYSKIERILRKFHINRDNRCCYYNSLVEKYRAAEFDKVIVMGGGFPDYFISELRKCHMNVGFVLYMSADRRSYGFTDEYLGLFDRVLTYSLNDAREFNIEYRPWFYSDSKSCDKTVDISFIGTIHPSRHSILSTLLINSKFGLRYFIYSPDRLSYLKNCIKWRNLSQYISFNGLPYDEYIDLLAVSRATLDIPEATQTNITTRPIEALATRTKIITTNKYITRYDFYHHDNIFIIEHDFDPTLVSTIQDWLCKPYVEIPIEIINNYSIESFCNEIIQ